MRIDLIWIDSIAATPPDWGLGGVMTAESSPRAVAAAAARRNAGAEAVLFWDAALGAPDEAAILAAVRTPGDVWHAGLSLGMGHRPRMIDYVDPVWRFNRDPAP